MPLSVYSSELTAENLLVDGGRLLYLIWLYANMHISDMLNDYFSISYVRYL